MGVTAFLHQKGGTGKSTLAVATALALAGRGERVLLVDADPQGTTSEWAMRYGEARGVAAAHHIQPDLSERLRPLREDWPYLLIDGPPSLNPITESIVHASSRVVIPMRPALPDVWAVPWLAAIVRKARREGMAVTPLALFNMHAGEPLAPLLAELEPWGIPAWPESVSADPALAALFSGGDVPATVADLLMRVLGEEGGAV